MSGAIGWFGCNCCSGNAPPVNCNTCDGTTISNMLTLTVVGGPDPGTHNMTLQNSSPFTNSGPNFKGWWTGCNAGVLSDFYYYGLICLANGVHNGGTISLHQVAIHEFFDPPGCNGNFASDTVITLNITSCVSFAASNGNYMVS